MISSNDIFYFFSDIFVYKREVIKIPARKVSSFPGWRWRPSHGTWRSGKRTDVDWPRALFGDAYWRPKFAPCSGLCSYVLTFWRLVAVVRWGYERRETLPGLRRRRSSRSCSRRRNPIPARRQRSPFQRNSAAGSIPPTVPVHSRTLLRPRPAIRYQPNGWRLFPTVPQSVIPRTDYGVKTISTIIPIFATA